MEILKKEHDIISDRTITLQELTTALTNFYTAHPEYGNMEVQIGSEYGCGVAGISYPPAFAVDESHGVVRLYTDDDGQYNTWVKFYQ